MRNAAGGFTLIEIMIALAILGTALFVLLEAHYGALKLFTDARDQVELNGLMKRAMGVAEGEVLDGSTSGRGEFGKRYPDYSYTYQVEDIGGTQQPGFLSISVVLHGPVDSREMILLVYKT
ncbi:MAG: prepilin-type N-terminal cleavage/methylation domain-containing protein [Candidatus Hydrogenedentes bacterium]|nr:prepilin-type N-terminal cleavage/methylation domain-containing protein [Candidatus Hydrogenedentota bacterium]